MDSTIILEARELAADVQVANGDWQTILAKPIPLYDGDQISLKSAILDTVSKTTGSITIDEDQILTVKGVPYIVDFARNANPIAVAHDASGVPQNMAYAAALTYSPDQTVYNRPDFARYYLNQVMSTATTQLAKIKFISFHPTSEYLSFKFTYTITYRNAANVIVKDTHSLGKQPFHKSFTVYDVNPIFNAANQGFRDGKPYQIDIVKWAGRTYAKVSNVGTEPAPNLDPDDSVITPFVAEANVHLFKGIYTPDELCTVINRGLTANASGITDTLSRSNLFFGSNLLIGTPISGDFNVSNIGSGYSQADPPIITFNTPQHGKACVVKGNVAADGTVPTIDVDYSGYGYSDTNLPNNPRQTGGFEPTHPAGGFVVEAHSTSNTSIFVNESPADENGVRVIKPTIGTGNMYLGASQVQLAYDQPTSKFVWKYLHTPIYSGSPPAETIQVANYLDSTAAAGATGPYHYGVAGSISGITLTELSSSALNMNFWSDTLGFDPQTILAKPKPFTAKSINLNPQGYYTRMFDPAQDPVGVAVTSAFIGNDAVYNKSGNANTWAVPAAKEFLSTVSADTTVGLAAEEGTGDLDQDKSGYYLLDIDGIKQSAVGSNTTSSSLQAIVSRYYNSGSYTTGDSSMGVVYQHKGPPQYLQSLKIRVLQPNGELADDVGNDSAVFLQIDRAAPQPKKG